MSCTEVEQIMANSSELNSLLATSDTSIHSNGFIGKEANYDQLNDVRKKLQL